MEDKNISNPVNYLLKKKMSRKHFFITVGAGAAAATGFSELTKNLINYTGFPIRTEGYGSTSYGTKNEKISNKLK